MKKMSIIALLLIAVVVTSSSVSGTYAKYTSTFNGSTDSARVAKWSFDIDTSTANETTNSFTFDLFNTINDTKDGAAEGDVANTSTIIAPGTEGSFEIKLENNSEVNATYGVVYSISNDANIPVEFSVEEDQNGEKIWTTSLAAVADKAIAMNGGQDTITIDWRWSFEGTSSENFTSTQTNTTDTALGLNGTHTITVGANITVTQVD